MSANIPTGKDALCDSTTLKSQAFLKQVATSLKLSSETVLYPIFNILSLNELEIAAWSIIIEKFGMDQRFTMDENLQITAFAAKMTSCYNVEYYQDLLERSIHDFSAKYQKWSARKEHDLSLTLKEVNARFKQMNDQCNSVNPLVDPWNGDFNAMVDFLDSDESTCQSGGMNYNNKGQKTAIAAAAAAGSRNRNQGQWDFLDDDLMKKNASTQGRGQNDVAMDFPWEETSRQQSTMYFDTGVQNSDALAPVSDDFFDEIDRFQTHK